MASPVHAPEKDDVVAAFDRRLGAALEGGQRVAQQRLAHGEPVRLAELAPLKIVVPSQANTRRMLLETYFASNGVAIERVLELDAMLGTLDFVARTDWGTILPAILMGEKAGGGPFTV